MYSRAVLCWGTACTKYPEEATRWMTIHSELAPFQAFFLCDREKLFKVPLFCQVSIVRKRRCKMCKIQRLDRYNIRAKDVFAR